MNTIVKSEIVFTLNLLKEKIKLLEDKNIDLELENYELRKRIENIYSIGGKIN
jgi:regulator of replication initiation timing